MFRLINSHLQAYSLQVKSQDAVHTLGSQCVYISCADVQISITIRIQTLRDVFIQIIFVLKYFVFFKFFCTVHFDTIIQSKPSKCTTLQINI